MLYVLLQPVHATVDEAGCRKFWGGRWRGRGGGCRGRKHERTWGGRGPQASESPSREDAALQAAIQASLEQPAPVESVAAPPAPKAAVPVVFVKPEVDEFSARFVSHVTLTDATPLVPGSTVVKTWRMKNEGATAWLSGTRLVHVGAETLGCPAEGVSVPAVAPGESVDISIALVAPSIPGYVACCWTSPCRVHVSHMCCCFSRRRHVGYFRLVTPAGVRFGHRIWADIFVENSNVASVIGSLVPPPAVKPAVEPAPSKPVVESAPSKPVVVSAPPSFPLLPTPSAPVDVAPAVLPVLPSPPVVPDVPAKWETQLLQMAEMGFYNIEANVRALEAFGGNVTRAVDSLLQ